MQTSTKMLIGVTAVGLTALGLTWYLTKPEPVAPAGGGGAGLGGGLPSLPSSTTVQMPSSSGAAAPGFAPMEPTPEAKPPPVLATKQQVTLAEQLLAAQGKTLATAGLGGLLSVARKAGP